MPTAMLPENPTLEQYITAAESLATRGADALSAAADAEALETARVQFLGDRRGELLALQKALGTLPVESRRDAGRAFNDAKTRLTAALEARRAAMSRSASTGPRLDLTMP